MKIKKSGWDVWKEQGYKALKAGNLYLNIGGEKISVQVDWMMKRGYNRKGQKCERAYEICLSSERTDKYPRLGGDRNPYFLWLDDLGEDKFIYEN